MVALTDPRVRIVFPDFSQIHTQALAMVARWLGLHPGEVAPLDRGQLERRQPGEILGFFMVRGGAPCVVDSYPGYFERFIAEQRLADVFMFDLWAENNYGGFNLPELTAAVVGGNTVMLAGRFRSVLSKLLS